jgi:Protein of unknown function (DUF3662)/FHA domain
MMLDRLERAIERLVEGSVAGAFRLRVQPADIGRELERAMQDGRVTSVGATLAPNSYEVRLHPDDAASFDSWEDALCREMEKWLSDVAYARGLATVAPFRVLLAEDADVPRRSVRASARFADRPMGRTAGRSARPLQLCLFPIDGAAPAIPLVDRPMRVGRADDNDLVLPDAGVSRRHARLEPDDTGRGWRVVDLQSTNGTWVNGCRVKQAVISPGDELAFAGLTFRVRPHDQHGR